MVNRVTRTVLFAASALLSMSAFGAGAARFGTLRNSDWVVTNAWQAVSNKTHDLILEIGHGDSLPPDWQNVSNAAMNAVQSLQPAYDYTDSALISFSSTGSVFRSLSYGTQNYWTDYTGCVWEVVIGSKWDIVYNEPEGSQYLIYIKPSGLGNGKYWEPYSGGYSVGDAKGDEDSTVLVWEGDAITDFTATRTLGLNTNLVGRVAFTNDILDAISTNNQAFVSAVLAAPLVGADPNDLSELAEYGSYGTVGAALLALIAGLAALKRRMNAAETSIDGKASLSDLPYALVTPGEWDFSPSSYDGREFSIVEQAGSEVGTETYLLFLGIEQVGGIIDGETNELGLVFEAKLVSDPDNPFSVTATRPSLPSHLLDRAVNEVSVTKTTTLILPALVNAGKARDFLVRLEISGSTVPTITFSPDGNESVTYETDGDEFPVPDEAGDWLYSFTETAAHTFAVSLKKVNTVAQGGS